MRQNTTLFSFYPAILIIFTIGICCSGPLIMWGEFEAERERERIQLTRVAQFEEKGVTSTRRRKSFGSLSTQRQAFESPFERLGHGLIKIIDKAEKTLS